MINARIDFIHKEAHGLTIILEKMNVATSIVHTPAY